MHPEIYLPKNEIAFFEDPDYGKGDLKKLQSMIDAPGGKLVGIKRPIYLGKPEVAPRIKHHLPWAKFIVSLRDPVERALASYMHYAKFGFIPAIDPNKGFLKLFDNQWLE